jgi:hypothetical protein
VSESGDDNRFAALAEKLAHLARMDANLRYTHGKVLAWWSDERLFSALSPDQLEILSAFKSRFAELQDHLGSAMKLIAEIENEDTRLFTYVINYMEQLEILPSMEAWLKARDLRNKATHDYSAPDEDKLRHFSELLAYTPDLYRTYVSLKAFVEHHYLNRKKS